MDNEVITKIINDYEVRLKRNDNNFNLSPFEKMLMQECLQYGYEFCLNNKNVQSEFIVN